jgi:hypothetical protein
MEPITLTAPALRHAFDMRVQAGAPLNLGDVRFGQRRVIPIRGGIVSGPRINGKLLDVGADFQTLLDDETVEIDARHLIETHDGAVIELFNQGIRTGTAADHTMRTSARLECGDARYSWVKTRLFLGCGKRLAEGVVMSFYEVG